MPLSNKHIIKNYLPFILILFSIAAYSQTIVPDSLLYREWDKNLLGHQSQPWTDGCDSVLSPNGITYYYNIDSTFQLMATRSLNEIIEEVAYFYFIVEVLNKPQDCLCARKKLKKDIAYNKSTALENEVDILDTYCFFLPADPTNSLRWNYFWELIEKYEKKGDYQTKLRIMERMLFACSGFPTTLVTSQIKKDRIPVIKLMNEILSTLEHMDEPYAMGPAYFYTHIGLIYYNFKYYEKAVPLLWKGARQSTTHRNDRNVMMARDYLGDYYRKKGDYDLSDSLYLSILKSPDQILDRPIDDVVAIGGLAANANLRGQKDEALRLYSIALSQTLPTGDSTLAGGYAVDLGRLYMERGDLAKTGDMIRQAHKYLVAGALPIRYWEKYYTLNRDYYLKLNKANIATLYLDSITMIRSEEDNIFNLRTLAYAEQEAFEMETALKEEQIHKREMQIILAGVILILALVLLVVMYYYNRKLKRKNRDLFFQIKERDAAAARHEELLLHYGNIIYPEISKINGSEISDNEESPVNNRQRELFMRLREYLLTDRNFAKAEIDTNALISILSTNRSYLFEAIKSFTGKTLQEYINALRMNEAKHLLETTDELIEEIAITCGYNSVRTFYRLFRLYYNISPSVYRKVAKEQS